MRAALPFLVVAMLAGPTFADPIAISDVQRGQPVTVAGVVDRFHDEDEIRLRDESGTLRIYLGPRPPALSIGQRIEVSGMMDDDLIGKELYAREIVTEEGEVITLERGYE